jgi:hypothetical protein
MSDAAVQRLMNALNKAQGIPNFDLPITDQTASAEFKRLDDQPVPDKDVEAILKITGKMHEFMEPNFKRLFSTHLYDQILAIRLTKSTKVVNTESWKDGNAFNSKVAVIFTERNNGKFNIRGVDGTGFMRINKEQLNIIEVNQGDNWLKQFTLEVMLNIARQATGLGMSSLRALGNSDKIQRQLGESTLLRRFYPKVIFSLTGNDESEITDLKEFINLGPNDNIKDINVLNRIVEVSNSVGQANFIYVPTASVVNYITAIKTDILEVEVRTYTVDGGLPQGAFVVSTGGWNVENHGTAGRVSVHDLMEEFRASN